MGPRILVNMALCPLSWASGGNLLHSYSRSLVLLVILVVIHQYVPSCNVYTTCPLTRDTIQHCLSMVLVGLEHAVTMTPSINHFQFQPLLVPVHVSHPCHHKGELGLINCKNTPVAVHCQHGSKIKTLKL